MHVQNKTLVIIFRGETNIYLDFYSVSHIRKNTNFHKHSYYDSNTKETK